LFYYYYYSIEKIVKGVYERKVRNDTTGATMDVKKNMLEVTEEKLLRSLGNVKGMLRNRSPGIILEREPQGT
jgi:hypothetical protein